MTDKTFGKKTPDVLYEERRGAYLIALERGTLHAAKTSDGIYLLGGKTADGETSEDAILRACLGITGYDASVEDFVADTDVYGENGTYETRTYFCGTLIEQITSPTDPAYTHVQLSLTDLDRLTLESDRYAVEQSLSMLRADAHGSDDEDL